MNNIPNNQQTGPPWFTFWIVASVLQMLFCNMLSGIVCLVLTLQADSEYKRGMFTEAESKHKLLPFITIGGIILAIICCGIMYIWCIEIIREIFDNPYIKL